VKYILTAKIAIVCSKPSKLNLKLKNHYFCLVKTDEIYMRRCIELAKNGLGTTYPNPMVGCVVVYDGKIIGEGWHKKSGTAHAEVHAIHAVKDKSLLNKATLYVSLEPCSHFGKTPPCCDLIIENKIPKVVIGTIDPNQKVAGKGIKKIVESGAHVTVGVLEPECLELNKRFFTYHQKKRPYIILKWAESQDGFLAPVPDQTNDYRATRKPVWITNEFSRQVVHKWRSEEQALLIGTQTAIDDNPKLDVRDWHGNNPIRIILDKNNRIPKDSYVFNTQQKTIFLCESNRAIHHQNCIFETIDFEQNLGYQIMETLYKQAIQSVIVEGGRQTLQTFIDENLWDEARIFVGTTQFKTGIPTPILNRSNAIKKTILNDSLFIIRNHD
jgi:diaminohydroxyphosphoribosylaminopyrimidine deaminase/5-amino-6-(5-phosphoribosylamino)uracil reductase